MTGAPSPTVFVVDDDASVLRGLSRLIRSAGFAVEIFAKADEFLKHPPNGGPGCVLIDLRMPGMNGLELQHAIAAAGHLIPVIFISGDGDIPATVQAMKAGAVDFLTKPFDEEQLLDAIRRALAHDAEGRAQRRQLEQWQARYNELTPREREVCHLVARGLLNKQIAFELGATEKTIKVHRARVMDKLEVQSVADLVRIVDRLGK